MKNIISRFKCRIFGHKWIESDEKYREKCSRKNCFNERILVGNRYPKIGEPAYYWEELDWNKFLK